MEESLQIAICEDRSEDVEKLCAILNTSSIKNTYTLYNNAQALLNVFSPQKYDLMLMDIYMDGMTGIEAVTMIRAVDPDVPVAFITISPDFTLESYRLHVLRYIEKPYSAKEIDDVLKLAKLEKESKPCLVFQKNGSEHRIPFQRILYIEAQDHLLMIHLQNGEIISFYEKMSTIEPNLPKSSFFVPHKSFAVNFSHVQYIDEQLRCFLMSNGDNVPIRRESMTPAKKALERYLFSRARGHL